MQCGKFVLTYRKLNQAPSSFDVVILVVCAKFNVYLAIWQNGAMGLFVWCQWLIALFVPSWLQQGRRTSD